MKWIPATQNNYPPVEGYGHTSVDILMSDGHSVQEGYFDAWPVKFYSYKNFHNNVNNGEYPNCIFWTYKPVLSVFDADFVL